MKLSSSESKVLAERFEEYKEKLEELMDKIEEEVEKLPGVQRKRAESYWVGHIRGALDNEESGGSMFTMQDTIDELYEEEQDE